MRVGKLSVYASHAAVPTPDNANFGIVYKYSVDGTTYIKTSDGVSTPIIASNKYLVEDNIVAFAGGGDTNATLLSKEYSRIKTVASANDSCKLPSSSTVGMKFVISNESAEQNDVRIYGNIEDEVAAYITIAFDNSRTFISYAEGVWTTIS